MKLIQSTTCVTLYGFNFVIIILINPTISLYLEMLLTKMFSF